MEGKGKSSMNRMPVLCARGVTAFSPWHLQVVLGKGKSGELLLVVRQFGVDPEHPVI